MDGEIDEQARKKFFNNIWTRIRGGFNSGRYSLLLQNIDRDIVKLDKLSNLTTEMMQLEPVVAKKNRALSSYSNEMRNQAHRLFESLDTRFYTCTCHHPHQANLQIDTWKFSHLRLSEARSMLLFTFNKASRGSKAIPWHWRDVEVET